MKRIMITVAYDGTAYHGWQIQPNGVTIEEKLNQALCDLTGEDIRIIGASRTDAGVHAMGNLAVFDTQSRIASEKFSAALNARLPEDIRVFQSVEVAADFHPRHCDSKKPMNTEFTAVNLKIPSEDSMPILFMYRSMWKICRRQQIIWSVNMILKAFVQREHRCLRRCGRYTRRIFLQKEII